MSPRLSLSDLFLRAQPDERLAAMAAQGHERAFTVLVERHRRALARYARRLAGPGREEDVVQQALLLSWRALERGTRVERVEAWLHRIVHNVAMRELARGARPAEPLGDDVVDLRHAPAALEQRLEARELLREISTLPERQRLALLGTELEGRSRRQLARELGLSEGAVRQLVHRARTTMRSAAAAVIPMPLLIRLLGPESGAAGVGAPDGVGGALAALSGAASASGLTASGLLVKAGVAVVAAGAIGGGVLVHELGSRHTTRHAAGAAAASATRGARIRGRGGGSLAVADIDAAGVPPARAAGSPDGALTGRVRELARHGGARAGKSAGAGAGAGVRLSEDGQDGRDGGRREDRRTSSNGSGRGGSDGGSSRGGSRDGGSVGDGRSSGGSGDGGSSGSSGSSRPAGGGSSGDGGSSPGGSGDGTSVGTTPGGGGGADGGGDSRSASGDGGGFSVDGGGGSGGGASSDGSGTDGSSSSGSSTSVSSGSGSASSGSASDSGSGGGG